MARVKTIRVDIPIADLKKYGHDSRIILDIHGTVTGVEEMEDYDVPMPDNPGHEKKRPKKGVLTVEYSKLKIRKSGSASGNDRSAAMAQAYTEAEEEED